MRLEEGVSTFLMGGFVFISLVFLVGVIVIACSTRCWKVTCCFALQWSFTWLAFQFFWSIVVRGGVDPMLTENNSFDLGMSGVCWGFSIMLMLLGLYFLTKHIKTQKGSLT